MERDSRNCLNPDFRDEFCGCSGISLRTTENSLQKAKVNTAFNHQKVKAIAAFQSLQFFQQ